MYGVALLMLEISTDFSGAATDFFRLDGIGLPLKVGSSKSGYANHAPLRALSEWVGTQIEGNQGAACGRPRAPAAAGEPVGAGARPRAPPRPWTRSGTRGACADARGSRRR